MSKQVIVLDAFGRDFKATIGSLYWYWHVKDSEIEQSEGKISKCVGKSEFKTLTTSIYPSSLDDIVFLPAHIPVPPKPPESIIDYSQKQVFIDFASWYVAWDEKGEFVGVGKFHKSCGQTVWICSGHIYYPAFYTFALFVPPERPDLLPATISGSFDESK